MKIVISLINIRDKKLLNSLLKEYQRGILESEFVEEYKYLDSYWEKPDRFPYFINVDGEVAGFALVNNHTLILEDAKNISEFYIKPEFRNKGIGTIAAKKIFKLFPGKWEVRELKHNVDAQKFWRKVIIDFTKDKFKETFVDNEKWNGPIQTFNLGGT